MGLKYFEIGIIQCWQVFWFKMLNMRGGGGGFRFFLILATWTQLKTLLVGPP